MFLVEFSEQDLNLINPVQIPVRFAKKATYDYDNLWFKFPFFFEKGQITGIKIYIKILRFLYGQAYTYNNKQTKGNKSYEDFEK